MRLTLAVRLTLVRHATLLVESGGRRLIVDPMLDPAGARGPVRGTPGERPNPLIGLPLPAAEVVAGVGGVLLTHTHVDHLDAAGVTTVPPGVPWFCQPEDLADLQPSGWWRDPCRPAPRSSGAASGSHAPGAATGARRRSCGGSAR